MDQPRRVTVADIIRYHEARDREARLQEQTFEEVWDQTEKLLRRVYGRPESISQTMENSPGGIQSVGDIIINK